MKKNKIENKYSLIEIAEGISKRIDARSILASAYGRPVGVGDEREKAIRDELRFILPSHLGVDKGRIIDSHGRISPEFDIIIYEASDCFSAVTIEGRRLISVESVFMVLEVKTHLKSDEFDKFLHDFSGLKDLVRFYRPAIRLGPAFTQQRKDQLATGLSAAARFPDDKSLAIIPPILASLIAFKGPKGKTLSNYLARAPKECLFLTIMGREFITYWSDPKGYKGLSTGHKSIGLHFLRILALFGNHFRPLNYRPDFSRYSALLNNEIGKFQGWSMELKEE